MPICCYFFILRSLCRYMSLHYFVLFHQCTLELRGTRLVISCLTGLCMHTYISQSFIWSTCSGIWIVRLVYNMLKLYKTLCVPMPMAAIPTISLPCIRNVTVATFTALGLRLKTLNIRSRYLRRNAVTLFGASSWSLAPHFFSGDLGGKFGSPCSTCFLSLCFLRGYPHDFAYVRPLGFI